MTKESELYQEAIEQLEFLENAYDARCGGRGTTKAQLVRDLIVHLADARLAYGRKAFFYAADLFVNLDEVRDEMEAYYQGFLKSEQQREES